MTDAELSEIRARCEAATPGTWEDGCDEKFHVVVQGTEEKIATMSVRFDREQNCYNAIFIAHARTDIPALLAHIEAQRAEIEHLTRALKYVARLTMIPRGNTLCSILDCGRCSVDCFVWQALNDTKESTGE